MSDLPVEFFHGNPASADKMWCLECDAVADYCVGRGCDVGAGGRTLFPDTLRIDCFPDQNPDRVADALALPFADGELDYVFSGHTIEHLADPAAAIREWLRCVRPGGHVVIVAPDTRYTRGQNTDRTPHRFEWAPEDFAHDALGWERQPGPWFTWRGPALGAAVVSFDVACPNWSFHVVLQKGGPT